MSISSPVRCPYRHGTQDWRLSVNGTDVLQVTGAGASTPSVVNVLNGSLQQAGVQVIPPGTELAFAGVTVPTGFLLEYGQTISRTTYPNLLSALRVSFTCTFANGSPTLSSVSADLRNLGLEGATLECATAGITNLTISSIAATTITMSGNATANSGGTVTVYAYPWGNGDGTSTFAIPDRRGRVLAGRDNMGGTAANRLTTAGSGINGISLMAAGGSQTQTILQANLPNVNFPVGGINITATPSFNYTPTVGGTIPSGSTNVITSGTNVDSGTGAAAGLSVNLNIISQGSAASGGTGTALSVVQPSSVSNYIIKY